MNETRFNHHLSRAIMNRSSRDFDEAAEMAHLRSSSSSSSFFFLFFSVVYDNSQGKEFLFGPRSKEESLTAKEHGRLEEK